MNRAERRAIKFGRAFSPVRGYYNRTYGGEFIHLPTISTEIEFAWSEYCNHQPDPDHALEYAWFGINDCYNSD